MSEAKANLERWQSTLKALRGRIEDYSLFTSEPTNKFQLNDELDLLDIIDAYATRLGEVEAEAGKMRSVLEIIEKNAPAVEPLAPSPSDLSARWAFWIAGNAARQALK